MAVDRNMGVLIVDDMADMRRAAAGLLRKLDFTNIAEAADGNAALDLLAAGDFGLVISDWNMQPMSGLELLQRVRADARLKDLAFVLATAETSPEKRAEAEAAGASAYMVKPFGLEMLKGKLMQVLGQF